MLTELMLRALKELQTLGVIVHGETIRRCSYRCSVDEQLSISFTLYKMIVSPYNEWIA